MNETPEHDLNKNAVNPVTSIADERDFGSEAVDSSTAALWEIARELRKIRRELESIRRKK